MDSHHFRGVLSTLTDHQGRLLEIVYRHDPQWVTRSQIAQFMGKKQLNPYDKECLTLLSEWGLIEAGRRPSRVPNVAYANIYRVSEPALDDVAYWISLTRGEHRS